MTKVVVVPDEGELSPAYKGYLQQCFKGEVEGKAPCQWCGGLHERECRRVRRMVFHPSGERVQEVEFWPDGSWDESAIVWPEEVFT